MRGLLSMVGVALCCLFSTQVPSVRVLNGKPLAVDRLDAYLTEEMSSLGLPGLSIAIINDGRIAYHRVLGVSNVDTAAKVTDETLFDAGSMAKTPLTDIDGVWYGLGLRVKPSELGAEYRHGGYNLNFSSGFMFNAEQKFGYVFFTNCEKGQEFDARLAAFLATGVKSDPQ